MTILGVNEIIKVMVHPQIQIMSSFSHPQVVLNLYDFLCSVERKIRYFEERR